MNCCQGSAALTEKAVAAGLLRPTSLQRLLDASAGYHSVALALTTFRDILVGRPPWASEAIRSGLPPRLRRALGCLRLPDVQIAAAQCLETAVRECDEQSAVAACFAAGVVSALSIALCGPDLNRRRAVVAALCALAARDRTTFAHEVATSAPRLKDTLGHLQRALPDAAAAAAAASLHISGAALLPNPAMVHEPSSLNDSPQADGLDFVTTVPSLGDLPGGDSAAMSNASPGRASAARFDGGESLPTSPQVASFAFNVPGAMRGSSTASICATPSPTGLAEVVPGLFLGSFRKVADALSGATSASKPLDALLCVAAEIPSPFPLPRCLDPPTLETQHFHLRDDATQNIVDGAADVCVAIDDCLRRGLRVVVYCRAGKSRSVSCIVRWLMTRHNMTADDALAHVRRSHPIAEPNMHFLRQLRAADGVVPATAAAT
uniref:protein-tyrosine-phosphatase n=1 Tax=Neobodo designis TaxID=312471 RepID=A0A7S1L4R5_NEODS|mmetsp:Transcript_14771/g.45815  ORF Transcript_14771/g.45815 Transcript_14771/m.45815 type:complete len:435 (+) Transcript_14771:1072-2376(+)